MKKIIALSSLAFLMVMTAGCNTAAGFGKDLSQLGEHIKEKSKH